jgi:hypothetical protein
MFDCIDMNEMLERINKHPFPLWAASTFEQIDPEEMIASITSNNVESPFSEYTFWRYLGVKISTLNNWINKGDFPHYAKVGFGMMVTLHKLYKKYEEINENLDVPFVVELGTEWALIMPNSYNSDEGTLIGRGYKTKQDALNVRQQLKAGMLVKKNLHLIFSAFEKGNDAFSIDYESVDKDTNKTADFIYKLASTLSNTSEVETFVKGMGSSYTKSPKESIGKLIEEALDKNINEDFLHKLKQIDREKKEFEEFIDDDPIENLQLGKFTLYIEKKSEFAGNAFFNKRSKFNEEYESICSSISELLDKEYYEQKGKGKRIWAKLNDDEIVKLKAFAKDY